MVFGIKPFLKLPRHTFTGLILCLATLFSCPLHSTAQQAQANNALSNTNTNTIGRPMIGNQGKKVVADYQITFPQDHFQHPEYDIEWWYLTSNLVDENGNEYALQWTLFRFRTPQAANGWDNGQVYMAHASIHADEQHFFSERFGKGDVGNAGLIRQPLTLFMDDWKWQSVAQGDDSQLQQGLFPSTLSFNALAVSAPSHTSPSHASPPHTSVLNKKTQQNNDSIIKSDIATARLNLSTERDYVLHGKNGYSIKSGNAQHASYYYSQPFIKVDGELEIAGKQISVTGQAWFDHEWTSQLIDQQTAGWDWFSIHLDDGSKLMAFVMRLNGQEDYMTGTYIEATGTQHTLLPQDISMTVLQTANIQNKTIPIQWRITAPQHGIDVSTKVSKEEQFNPSRFEYYEGSIAVGGSHNGVGFMELTGY